MISKIIIIEKERQEKYLNGCGIDYSYTPSSPNSKAVCKLGNKNLSYCDECYSYQIAHKESLINLKQYMEELSKLNKYHLISGGVNDQLKRDIKELNLMIKRYAYRDKND